MQVLLTGARGFLGRALTQALLQAGHQLRALVRQESPLLSTLGVQQHIGDAAALDDVCAAAEGCEAIVHAAGLIDPLASVEALYEANVRSTDCMLAACELAAVPRLLLTSCASVVLGQAEAAGVDESCPYPSRWTSAYVHTKALAEQRVLAANSTQLATCVLRPHLLWGAGESQLLPALLDQAARGKLRLFGDPDARIDACHVDSAAHAHVLALARLQAGATIAGKAYFISQDEPLSIANFINGLLRAGGFPPETRRLSALAARALSAAARGGGEQATPLLNPYLLDLFSHASWFDLTAARQDLGYRPSVSNAEGMNRLFTQLTRERMHGRAT